MRNMKALGAAPKCECKTCRLSRGMDAAKAAGEVIEQAVEEWLNESCDMEMTLAYLREQVTEIAALPWWRNKRARLREALRVSA